jgi:hypothetical protein
MSTGYALRFSINWQIFFIGANAVLRSFLLPTRQQNAQAISKSFTAEKRIELYLAKVLGFIMSM